MLYKCAIIATFRNNDFISNFEAKNLSKIFHNAVRKGSTCAEILRFSVEFFSEQVRLLWVVLKKPSPSVRMSTVGADAYGYLLGKPRPFPTPVLFSEVYQPICFIFAPNNLCRKWWPWVWPLTLGWPWPQNTGTKQFLKAHNGYFNPWWSGYQITCI